MTATAAITVDDARLLLARAARDLAAHGLMEGADFVITGRPVGSMPSSEHVEVAFVDGAFSVFYMRAGERTDIVTTRQFPVAFEALTQAAVELGMARGREVSTAPVPHDVDVFALLDRLPAYKGVTFRGLREDTRLRQVGDTVTTTTPVPATRLVRVATENFATPAVLAVAAECARHVTSFSGHPDQGEVVFAPDTRLEVWKTAHFEDIDVVLAVCVGEDGEKIVPDWATPDRAATVVAAAIRAAHTAPEVPVPDPGKFVGDPS